jgi:hypothetical protein
VKATGATDKPHDEPHAKNVRLFVDTRSRAGAAGFDMRYAWVLAIALLVAIYAFVSFFF